MNETARLRALHRYGVLDTEPEAALDELTALAAKLCNMPIALIGLVDSKRVWFKSKIGLSATHIPRENSFSDRLIQFPNQVLVIHDTLEDEPFTTHPFSTIDPPIRFYAGAPLMTPEGCAIGAFCVLDYVPRQLLPEHVETLSVFSRQIIAQLELRVNISNLERTMVLRRRIERSLHDKNQQFRQALEELRHTQTQLVQTEKMSSLGQMLAGVAHEINNPVSFVYGNLTYVNRYAKDLFELLELYQKYYPQPHPDIQQAAEAIDLDFVLEDLPKIIASMKIGADRIRQIVLSLRNFSRLDDSDKKPVDIHQGIDSTLMILEHRLKPSLEHSGIEVVREYGDLPLVECYAGQLNQVFMNILSNAIDALESSNRNDLHDITWTPTITICTEVIQPENDATPAVCIHIADNGSGIPPQVQAHVFDPFFTTKSVGKGTGLGLSISYQVIVERHSGKLECRSREGQGTEFYIEIPVQEKLE